MKTWGEWQNQITKLFSKVADGTLPPAIGAS